MKKLSILLLSAVALISTFTACSDDDNPPAGPSIIGKWEWKKIIISTSSESSGEIDWPEGISLVDEHCGIDYITFTNDIPKSNNGVPSTAPSGAKNSVYADSYETTPGDENTCTSGDVNAGYTLNDKTLTIYDLYTEPQVFTITSITDKELRLRLATDAGNNVYILERK